MKKKVLSVLLILCLMLSGMTGMAFAATQFTDVPADAYYVDAVIESIVRCGG